MCREAGGLDSGVSPENIGSSVKFKISGEGERKHRRWFDYDESEKGKHLFMSLIQRRAGQGRSALSPTDGNHL